ncbi:MAG: hypothetical protein IJ089_04385 [Clostridia bacterium]|nr:hypothetical protein [Clostridia bacterium]
MIQTDNSGIQEFKDRLRSQLKEITDRLCVVYHISEDEATRRIQESAFYQALTDSSSKLLFDSAEDNFLRLQNEIEYGDWRE